MIKQFEDLPVWEDARKLTKQVYDITKKNKFKNDFRLKGQIQSSSVSVMSNIAEGFENQSKKQFIRYLFIARGSCGELRSQFYVCYDVGYINDKLMQKLKNEATSISKQCSGLIRYLEGYNSSNESDNMVREFDPPDFLQLITEYYH